VISVCYVSASTVSIFLHTKHTKSFWRNWRVQ